MKQLYVFGDSFMTQDRRHRGEHWSEMMPGYNAVIKSQSGCSNSMIAFRAFSCLVDQPDAVVVGFTAMTRLNFDMPTAAALEHDRLWYNNGAVGYITSDQALACDYYAATVSERMMLFETYAILRSLFLTLEQRQIPFAWSPLMLDNNIAKELRCDSPDWRMMLGEFESKKIPLNLAIHPVFSDSVSFHTHDREWQQTFATQAAEIIQQQVDFYKK